MSYVMVLTDHHWAMYKNLGKKVKTQKVVFKVYYYKS